jgi:hypothetical protein
MHHESASPSSMSCLLQIRMVAFFETPGVNNPATQHSAPEDQIPNREKKSLVSPLQLTCLTITFSQTVSTHKPCRTFLSAAEQLVCVHYTTMTRWESTRRQIKSPPSVVQCFHCSLCNKGKGIKVGVISCVT